MLKCSHTHTRTPYWEQKYLWFNAYLWLEGRCPILAEYCLCAATRVCLQQPLQHILGQEVSKWHRAWYQWISWSQAYSCPSLALKMVPYWHDVTWFPCHWIKAPRCWCWMRPCRKKKGKPLPLRADPWPLKADWSDLPRKAVVPHQRLGIHFCHLQVWHVAVVVMTSASVSWTPCWPRRCPSL